MSEKRQGSNVLCKVCSQRCVLREWEYGRYGIRKNEGGQLYLTVYGLAAAYNIDPVEKNHSLIFYQEQAYFQLVRLGVILAVLIKGSLLFSFS